MRWALLLLGLATATFLVPAAEPAAPGMVAAYAFEETSGTAALDSSGSGNAGTVSGPVSSALGRFGRALAFDGVNDLVNVADSASLDLTTGMTLEAWVKPEGVDWQTVLLKERPGGLAYALYSSTDTGVSSGEVRTSSSLETRGSSSLPFATWSHLATTYDGSTLRLYVNGNQVSGRAVSGPVEVGTGTLRIGGNLVWGEYFRGLIDEVRVYQRALSAAEIQTDMQTPVVPSGTDTQPPSAPGGPTAAVTGDDVQLSWSASSDDTGVTGYRVHRSATNGFTPDAGNLVATSPAASYLDVNRPTGTWYYRVIAIDAAGNASGPSPQGSATIGVDSQPPTAPGNLAANVTTDDVQLTWSASSDNVGVTGYRVWKADTPGFTPGGNTSTLVATLGGGTTSYLYANRPIGTSNYRIVALDAAGNASASSAEVAATVQGPNAAAPSAPGSLTATVTGDVVELDWIASSDDVGVDTYRIYRSTTPGFWPYTTGNWLSQVDGSITSYTDDVNQASGTFYYKVIAHDALFNFSPQSNQVTATLGADTTPPTVSINDACDGAVAHSEYFDVNVPVSDDHGPVNLRVLVDGVQVFTSGSFPVSGPGTHFEWNTRNSISNGLHVMTAIARDGAGNEATSAPCTWLIHNKVLTVPFASPADGAVVSGIVPVAVQPRADGLPTNGFPFNGVSISVDGIYVGGGSSPPFQYSWDTRTVANGVHTLLARMYWLDYSSPQATSTIQVTVNNTSEPTAPGNLTATVLSGDDVHLTWSPSTGGGANITSYRVYRDDSLIATRDAALPREHDDVNAPVGAHQYKVLAVDTAGTAGPPSPEAPAQIVPDTTPPTATLGGASCGTVNGYVPLRPTVSDDRGAVAVRVEVDGAIVFGPVTAFAAGPYTDLTTWWTFFWEIGATPPGLHAMTVHATDSAGNEDVSEPCMWRVGVLSVPITSPADGATVSGAVLVNALPLLDDQPAAATGNVSGVHFKIDGVDAKFASGPAYQYIWDTTAVANGVHTLKADLYWLDYGAPRASSTIQVTVNNTVPQPTGLTADVTQDDVHLAWSPAPAGSGVTGYRVHRSSTASFAPTDANRIATPATALYDDLNRPVGTWYYKVVAAAGASPSQPSAEVSATIVAPPVPSGLVAAYGFDEASGTAVTDSSGTGNAGTITGATRSASGRYGGALSFDGLNDLVSIADSNSLDLTTGMTLEAWVRPVAVTNWRTVLLKERPGGFSYALYAGTDTGRPGGFLDIGGERSTRGTAALPLNTWTHVAATYDGANLRFFVNGTQTGVLTSTGAIPATTGQLRIGGNSVWSEWFRGLIDEVRVYNRALTAVEIQADRDRPVTP